MAGVFPKDIWCLLLRCVSDNDAVTLSQVCRRMISFMTNRQRESVLVTSIARRAYVRYRRANEPFATNSKEVPLSKEDHTRLVDMVLHAHRLYPRTQHRGPEFVTVEVKNARNRCDRYGLCYRCHIYQERCDHAWECPKRLNCQYCGLAGVGHNHEENCVLNPIWCKYCELSVPRPWLKRHTRECPCKCATCNNPAIPLSKHCPKHATLERYRRLNKGLATKSPYPPPPDNKKLLSGIALPVPWRP